MPRSTLRSISPKTTTTRTSQDHHLQTTSMETALEPPPTLMAIPTTPTKELASVPGTPTLPPRSLPTAQPITTTTAIHTYTQTWTIQPFNTTSSNNTQPTYTADHREPHQGLREHPGPKPEDRQSAGPTTTNPIPARPDRQQEAGSIAPIDQQSCSRRS